jgi:transglutaminase-like putative cysteine protease
VLKTVLLSGLAALVVAVDWLRFEDPRSSGERPFMLAALAIAPVLLRPLWLRIAALVPSLLLAAWVAFSVSPFDLWPGGDGYFGPLGSRFGGGFVDFYEFQLPIDPARQPHMHQVILAAIFGFVLAIALAIAARRVVLSVVCFLVGAGWPATLLAGGNEIGRGLVILAVTLTLLAGLAVRPSRSALVAAAAVLVGALALSSSAAVAKSAFLDWQHWDLYTRPVKPVSVRYVWDARYSGVRFPKKQTTVLMIRAPRTPQYWRATVLDRFDGTRWRERIWRETASESHDLTPDGARDSDQRIRQEVTVGALDDDHLVGASIPVAYNVSQPVVYDGQGVFRVPDGLHHDQHYTMASYSPRPTPAQLVRAQPDYPRALTRPGRELDLGRGVTAPPFGEPGRDARLFGLLTGRLEPYADVFKRANGVAGQTRSPYAVAVALERWFRATGGFTYSEQPGSTPGLPPLAGFVTYTQTGYCQHFAGSMALMLRLLGIPARVAAGFVSGRYRDGVWRVTDHDAHAWVEVWFRGYGWLPFDPTPGRGRLSGTYSSTSLGFNPAAAARLLAGVVKGGEVFGQGNVSGVDVHDPQRPNPRSAADLPVRGLGATPPPEKKHTPSLLLFLLLLCAGVVSSVVLLKVARRRLRYLRRDPRRIAAACARELGEYLQDQRIPARESATFHELGAALSDRLGVDPREFTQAANAARYGRPEQAVAAAQRAREELRELKRKLRRSLFIFDRARGLVSVRSLGLG